MYNFYFTSIFTPFAIKKLLNLQSATTSHHSGGDVRIWVVLLHHNIKQQKYTAYTIIP